MPGSGQPTAERPADLATLVRERREEILAEWEEQARRIPRAAEVSQPQLIDLIPPMLDRIADMVEHAAAGRTPEPPSDAAGRHALDRLRDGFDLADVVLELSLLRDCILRLWQNSATVARPRERADQRTVCQAIDEAILATVSRYTEARDRILRVLDRVSSTALEETPLEGLLHELATSFRDEVPSVDTLVILVREGDALTVRAATGLDEDVPVGFSVPMGEGFAGRVAAERRTSHLTSAADDPSLGSDRTAPSGLRALYGVPLLDGGELLGVAHMGSRTVTEFSDQDRVLFTSLTSRATAAVHHHLLRGSVERRARELEESERKFRATFENAAVGIAHVALDGTWLRLNRRYCEILGYSYDELMKVRFQDVTHPEDLGPDLESRRRLAVGDTSEYFKEKRYVRKDGSIVWVALSVALVRDDAGQPEYFATVAQDITGPRELRERLSFLSRASEVLGSTLDVRETLEQLSQIAVPVMADWCAVDLVDPGGGIGDFVAVTHRDPKKVELVRDHRGRYPARPDAPIGPAKVVRTGEPDLIPHLDDEVVRRLAVDEGHLVLLQQLALRSFLCVPLRQEGRVVGALSLASAESGREFGEDELKLAQELARRASVAIENARLHEASERAVALRDRILAVVSHDLRNPMSTIDLSSHLLLKNVAVRGEPRAHRRVETIQRNVRQASRLITDLLDLSSIQAGKLSLELTSCELSPLLEEAVNAHEPLAREEGIDLHRELEVNGQYVRCDRDRLLQVLSNLIGNAIKFCNSGDAITVRARPRAGEVVVSVADTGPGIAAEEKDHIFDLYWKGRQSERGTGLGLFIARGIIESHGGRLWVESQVTRGTTFSFSLPSSR